MRNKKAMLIILLVLCSVFFQVPVLAAEAPKVNYVVGPAKVDVSGYATINLSDSYLFANKEDTVKIMNYYENLESGAELGSVYSKDEKENWFIIFEYFETGHIKDKDKNSIDADELLESYTKNTEKSNKERKKKDMSELHVIGWKEEPKYNDDLHTLTWCTLLRSDNGMSANYEARLLCREGYVAATLVCTDTELDLYKVHLNQVVDNFNFNVGKRYEDYVEGKDKLSDYGLAALIIGGTAVATKKGLLIVILAFLKKGGIILIVPLFAFIKKIFSKIFGINKKTSQVQSNDTLSSDYNFSQSAFMASSMTAATSERDEQDIDNNNSGMMLYNENSDDNAGYDDSSSDSDSSDDSSSDSDSSDDSSSDSDSSDD